MKKLILIILTPAVQTSETDKNDVTIRSKSSAGSSYSDGWDAVWGKEKDKFGDNDPPRYVPPRPSTLH